MYLIQLLHYKNKDHIKDWLIDDIKGATVEIEQIYTEPPPPPPKISYSFCGYYFDYWRERLSVEHRRAPSNIQNAWWLVKWYGKNRLEDPHSWKSYVDADFRRRKKLVTYFVFQKRIWLKWSR